MNPSREELVAQAESLGERYGDVIVKVIELPSTYYRPEYATVFLGDAAVDTSLVPVMQKRDDLRYSYGYQDNDWRAVGGMRQRLYEGALRSSTRHKLSALAAPALGTTVELATQSPLTAIVATLGGVAAYGGSLIRTDSRKRAALGHKLDVISQKLQTPGEVITFKNTGDLLFLDAETSKAIENRDIPVAGSENIVMKGTDVLSWMEKYISDYSTNRYNGALHISHWSSEFSTEGATPPLVRPNSTLWKLFESTERHLSMQDKVASFREHRDTLAQQANVVLQPAHFNDDRHGISEKYRVYVKKDWYDAPVSLIYLPPSETIIRLFKRDTDPTELWSLIAPEVVKLEQLLNTQESIKERTAFIKSRHDNVGYANEGDREELVELQATNAASRQESLITMLSIVATAVVRDRRHRYDTMREELLSTIEFTSNAEDQFGALSLFGTAIDALALQLEPDSEEAITTAKELADYLRGVARFIDGNESVYRQVYGGLRSKFPQLKLPIALRA